MESVRAFLIVAVFSGIGDVLRALSLKSDAGNALALLLYAVISLLPALAGLLLRRMRRGKADWLFVLASAYLFFLLYYLINPHRIYDIFRTAIGAEGALLVMELQLIGGFLALLIASITFRLISSDGRESVLRQLDALLFLFQALILIAALGGDLSGLVKRIALRAEPGWYLVIQYLSGIAPELTLCWMLNACARLIEGMRGGWFSEVNGSRAEELSKRGRAAVGVTVVSMLFTYAFTLLFANYLSDVSTVVNLPLTELLIACVSVVVARFVASGCALKRENDLMI